jgi:hypothetical protein
LSSRKRNAPATRNPHLEEFFSTLALEKLRSRRARCAFVIKNAQRGWRDGGEIESATSAPVGGMVSDEPSGDSVARCARILIPGVVGAVHDPRIPQQEQDAGL